MKRHEALVPLSRDHHEALLLARLIQKGAPDYKKLPTETADKVVYALDFYHKKLVEHFLAEENDLISRIRGINKELDELADEIILEHRELRLLFELLPLAEKPEEHLDILGAALEKHIRKEERKLFPLIQDSCSESLLAEIMPLLAH